MFLLSVRAVRAMRLGTRTAQLEWTSSDLLARPSTAKESNHRAQPDFSRLTSATECLGNLQVRDFCDGV